LIANQLDADTSPANRSLGTSAKQRFRRWSGLPRSLALKPLDC
jgi:hypothetical protein